MNISRLLNSTLTSLLKRNFCNLIREELTVQTFCDINVNVPYNVKIKPLDVHKYQNCDKLRIELTGVKAGKKSVRHVQDGNNIKIFAPAQDHDQETMCSIEAPVKANLSVNAHGNISAGIFSGSKLVLKSTRGNISVKKFQGDVIDLSTVNGDIILKGAVVASNIKLVTDTGSITVKRLQGLDTLLKTNIGDISVESSYCDNGTFEATNGDLNLQNLHKNSKVYIKNGRLTLSGLDGQLDANIENGDAEIQISRILENSEIKLSEKGALKLLLSEDCQEMAMFEIVTKDHILDPSVRLIPSLSNNILYLTPTAPQYKQVKVECGQAHIQNASWMDRLKLNFQD